MTWFVSRNLLAGAASVCVVGLGIAMVWPVFTPYGDERVVAATRSAGENVVPLERNELESTALPVPPALLPPPQPLPPQLPPREQRASAGSKLPSAPSASPGTGEGLSKQAVAQLAAELRRRQEAENFETDARADQQKVAEEIVVQGVRARQLASMESKSPMTTVDAISAEDVGQFPDASAGKASRPAILSTRSDAIGGVIAPAAPRAGFTADSRDKFEHFEVNPLWQVADKPESTFSVDVDTASYSFARRMLNGGELPQKDSVRVEEMINYFDYAWPAAKSAEVPFEPTLAVSDSPWGKGKKLVHIGIKGYELDRRETPDSNLVLLLDVSGSMDYPDKLPLAVKSMELLLESLKPTDTVGIVVYAGAAGTVLEPTPVREKEKILRALRDLSPGGSTAGAEGIERAYQLAERSFRKGGVNRILLATDGDFNVGIDDTNQLKGYIERKREKGIYLSVLGFGQGNYRDELAQALAQNGNGVAVYIDTLNEARKVLVEEATSSLFTIAQDVKLQVEFNPVTVSEYRLVGYETRALRREDFNNDAIDAGDVGSGHTVTAIYEITPANSDAHTVDERRYPENRRPAASRGSRDEYGFLRIRYKLPGQSKSRLLERPIPVATQLRPEIRREVAFSTAVAGFGQLLRGGSYTGTLTYEDVISQAQSAMGEDRFGYRAEFVQLVRKAEAAQRK